MHGNSIGVIEAGEHRGATVPVVAGMSGAGEHGDRAVDNDPHDAVGGAVGQEQLTVLAPGQALTAAEAQVGRRAAHRQPAPSGDGHAVGCLPRPRQGNGQTDHGFGDLHRGRCVGSGRLGVGVLRRDLPCHLSFGDGRDGGADERPVDVVAERQGEHTEQEDQQAESDEGCGTTP